MQTGGRSTHGPFEPCLFCSPEVIIVSRTFNQMSERFRDGQTAMYHAQRRIDRRRQAEIEDEVDEEKEDEEDEKELKQ